MSHGGPSQNQTTNEKGRAVSSMGLRAYTPSCKEKTIATNGGWVKNHAVSHSILAISTFYEVFNYRFDLIRLEPRNAVTVLIGGISASLSAQLNDNDT